MAAYVFSASHQRVGRKAIQAKEAGWRAPVHTKKVVRPDEVKHRVSRSETLSAQDHIDGVSPPSPQAAPIESRRAGSHLRRRPDTKHPYVVQGHAELTDCLGDTENRRIVGEYAAVDKT
jgi:hypothetical protein